MSRRISVLVIDDDKSIHEILKYELELCGFEVYCARSGKKGIKLANKLTKIGKPEVILLDWVMPKMNGLEVLSELKHNNETEFIPVFMCNSQDFI